MHRHRTKRIIEIAVVLAAVAVCALPARAQVEVGDNLKMNLSGNLGFGQAASWGNFGDSTRSINFMGNGSLTGSYYHPNFLSFTVQPHYNRNKNNGVTDSTFGNSGVNASVNLFTGSRFPGSVFYGKEFNNVGEFGIPGTNGLNSSGSAQNAGITWSLFLPKLPSLTAAYSASSSTGNIVGLDGDLKSGTHTFSLDSRYSILGFDLGAYYLNQDVDATFPSFFGTGATATSNGSSTYGLSANHKLPLSGNFGVTWAHTSYAYGNDDQESSNNNATIVASISPLRRVTLTGDIRYASNLFSDLQRTIVGSGGTPVSFQGAGQSVVYSGMAYLSIGKGLSLNGHVTHRDQEYYGRQVSDTQYGGTVNFRYARPLLGALYFSFGLVDTATQEGNSALGFTGNLGYSKKFGRWDTNADFSYSHNVQTLVALYTTSNYTYGAFVRRRLTYYTSWQGSFRAVHSGFTVNDGDSNRSETFSTGINWKSYGVTAAYSQSKGRAVLTSSGLLNPTPLPPELISDNFMVFDGRSSTIGAHAAPLKHTYLKGYYSKVKSNTSSPFVSSINDGNRYNGEAEYRLRKLAFRAGYTRTGQVISAAGGSPRVVNSYYFGITRWFDVF